MKSKCTIGFAVSDNVRNLHTVLQSEQFLVLGVCAAHQQAGLALSTMQSDPANSE